ESSPRLDGRQPTLHDFSRKLTRPVREKVTNALAVLVAGDCRTINIVKDVGLTEVIRIASGDNSYDLPLYDGERARKIQLPASPLLVTTGRQSEMTISLPGCHSSLY